MKRVKFPHAWTLCTSSCHVYSQYALIQEDNIPIVLDELSIKFSWCRLSHLTVTQKVPGSIPGDHLSFYFNPALRRKKYKIALFLGARWKESNFPMLGNYVHYFVMFTLSEAYEILSCDFLENAAAPASASLRPAAWRAWNVGINKNNIFSTFFTSTEYLIFYLKGATHIHPSKCTSINLPSAVLLIHCNTRDAFFSIS